MQILAQATRHAFTAMPLRQKPVQNSLFPIFARAVHSTPVDMPPAVNSLLIPPHLVHPCTLKEAMLSIFTNNLDSPVSLSEKNYLHYYFSTDPSLSVLSKIKELELGKKPLQKLLLAPHGLSTLDMLADLHKLDTFNLTELETFKKLDLSKPCPQEILPHYLKVLHLQQPELIERLLLKGLTEIHRSKYDEEDRLAAHIALINHIIEP